MMQVLFIPVLILLLLLVVYRRWLHPLSRFPGPLMASVSGLYETYWSFQPDMALNFAKLHERYGPIVRYSPNGLIFSDHELLPVVYGRRADKSSFFAANFDSEATFNCRNYEDHVSRKKAIATAYSDPNLRLFEPGLNQLLENWLKRLQEGTSGGGSVDLHERVGWLATDQVTLLITGRPFGFIESGSDVRNLLYCKDNTFNWTKLLAISQTLSWCVRNTWIGRSFVMARPTDTAGVGPFMRERDCIMASVMGKTGDLNRSALVEGSLLSSLLLAHFAGDGMSLEEIRAEVLFALLAGSSVTPLNLWTIIYLVATQAPVQDALSLELERAERSGAIPSTAHVVSSEQAQGLPYLRACVREALRFAPTISQLPRLSPRDTGLELHGRHVPPGYSVSTSPWLLGRSERLFGPDAHVYRPERWLEAPEERRRYWDRNSFHFGYGGRTCAARRFALAQLHKSVAEVFRRFSVEAVGAGAGTSTGRPSTREFRFVLKEDGGAKRT